MVPTDCARCHVLYVVIDQFVFRHVAWIERTVYDHLSLHRTAEYRLDDIDKVLLCLETPDELGVIGGPERQPHRKQHVIIRILVSLNIFFQPFSPYYTVRFLYFASAFHPKANEM